MTVHDIVAAERKAADLAYYFDATDLHEKYKKAQAETDAEIAALEAKLEAVRKYADERAWYGGRNRTVNSARIASDLFHILGLGPDGKVSDGQQ